MKISLEYVVRSNVIRDLIDFPCSLFLEGAGGKEIVTFGRLKGNPEEIICKQYSLSDKKYEELPNTKTVFKVALSELFEDNRIIPEGCKPLRYFAVPVATKLNGTRHPMDEALYDRFTLNFFNTHLHRTVKRNWLWDAFSNRFNLPVTRSGLTSSYGRHLQKYDLYYIERNKPKKGLWGYWRTWERKLLINKSTNTAATELIFASLNE